MIKKNLVIYYPSFERGGVEENIKNLINNFSEKIIYKLFIHYCNFGNDNIIPEELQPICLSKPSDFSVFDSLENQIALLKLPTL